MARKLYFLSDIHIGTNETTSWYQQSIHERYLKAALKYIQDDGANVDDVVILGDFFDLWTYAPDAHPKTVANVIAANPSIFTRQNDGSGDFMTLMDRIQGNLHYINGNHDMTVDPTEVKQLLGGNPKFTYTSPDFASNLWYFNGPVIAMHGHEYSLICREDLTDSNNNNLPAGYFVTRSVGAISRQKVTSENVDNCAQLPDAGNPVFASSLVPALKVLEKWAAGKNRLSYSLLEFLTQQFGKTPESVDYTMPDGSIMNGKDAAELFRYLWVLNDDSGALKVDASNSLTDEAERIMRRQILRPTMVIMGHTHFRMGRNLENSVYINSGYMCPSIPDMVGQKKPLKKVPAKIEPTPNSKLFPTFVEVQIDGNAYSGRILEINPVSGEIKSRSGVYRITGN